MKNKDRSKTVTLTLTEEEWESLVAHTRAFEDRIFLALTPTATAKAMFAIGMDKFNESLPADKRKH